MLCTCTQSNGLRKDGQHQSGWGSLRCDVGEPTSAPKTSSPTKCPTRCMGAEEFELGTEDLLTLPVGSRQGVHTLWRSHCTGWGDRSTGRSEYRNPFYIFQEQCCEPDQYGDTDQYQHTLAHDARPSTHGRSPVGAT